MRRPSILRSKVVSPAGKVFGKAVSASPSKSLVVVPARERVALAHGRRQRGIHGPTGYAGQDLDGRAVVGLEGDGGRQRLYWATRVSAVSTGRSK